MDDGGLRDRKQAQNANDHERPRSARTSGAKGHNVVVQQRTLLPVSTPLLLYMVRWNRLTRGKEWQKARRNRAGSTPGSAAGRLSPGAGCSIRTASPTPKSCNM